MARVRTLLRRRLRGEHGFTAIEVLVVMVLMGIIMGSIAAIYVSGVHSSATLSSSFQAQTTLHIGFDKIRYDINNACSETAQSASSVTLSEPTCDGTNLVTWCTRASGTQYALYRVVGSTCTGGTKYGDNMTSGSIFTYTAQNTPSGSYSLPRLHIDVTVNVSPATATTAFRVTDDLVFRNGVRQ